MQKYNEQMSASISATQSRQGNGTDVVLLTLGGGVLAALRCAAEGW